MPIINQGSSIETQTKIDNSISRIAPFINQTYLDGIKIVIGDVIPNTLISSDKVKSIKKHFDEGFGIEFPIYTISHCYHFILVNFKNIKECHITDFELDSILAHELGHIFNTPDILNTDEFQPLKEFMSNNDGEMYKMAKDVIEQNKIINRYNKEFYADYYTKELKCDKALLTSIDKYLGSELSKNEDIFKLRIEKLKSKEKFIGTPNYLKLVIPPPDN